jgi:hypothetical protein
MTAIKPERPNEGSKSGTDHSGPEKFVPPERHPVEKLGDIEQAAATAFEGEIREFVRRDVAFVRRQQRNDSDQVGEPVTENLNSLIRRVSGASMDEIDRVIAELQSVREMLHKEGERVSREIAGYASLSHATMTAMKVISESVSQWKNAPGKPGPRST